MNRAVQRTYTQEALYAWLKHLEQAWDSQIADHILNEARKLYQNNRIKAFDLTPNSLSVQALLEDRKAPAWYAIVDIDAHTQEWAFRSSTEDSSAGMALAVAGIYELEEFLIQEDVHLTHYEYPISTAVKEVSAGPVDAQPHTPVDFSIDSSARSVRPIHLDFYFQGQTLCFKPHFDQIKGNIEKKIQHPQEREAWIRLMHWARKEGFTHHPQEGLYRLEGLEKAYTFLKQKQKEWGVHFKLNLPLSLKKFLQGKRMLDVRMRLTIDQHQPSLHIQPEFLIDGTSIEFEDIKSIVKNPQTGILHESGWLSLDPTLAEALQEWQLLEGQMPDGRWPLYMRYAHFIKNPIFDNPPPLLLKDHALPKKEAQLNLPNCLRHYQVQGVQWLSRVFAIGGHALLADEMGLGKTIQILSLIQAHEPQSLPSIVVCPASVVCVWETEVKRFFPDLRVEIIRGHTQFSSVGSTQLWITSYTQLRRHRSELSELSFAYAILDEAQTIKNPTSKTAQSTFSLKAQYRLAVTGTPIENKHVDLWSIFRFLMPGLLGLKTHFEARLKSPGAMDELKQQLSPFILRRLKKDVLHQLPAKTQTVLHCPLTDIQKEHYQQVVQQAKKTIHTSFIQVANRLHIFSLLTKLRQIVLDPTLAQAGLDYPPESSSKLMVLLERLEELIDNEEKVVVFSQFVQFLKRIETVIENKFPDLPIYKLTGNTTDRGQVVEGFQHQQGPAIFLASLKAAGAGITLHAASYVFLMDPWWNPAVEAQAIDRVHRLGQNKPVFVYRLIAPGTLEDKIEQLKQHKQGIFNDVLEDLPDLTRLEHHFKTLDELIELNELGMHTPTIE